MYVELTEKEIYGDPVEDNELYFDSQGSRDQIKPITFDMDSVRILANKLWIGQTIPISEHGVCTVIEKYPNILRLQDGRGKKFTLQYKDLLGRVF